jgi:hypothetical protein
MLARQPLLYERHRTRIDLRKQPEGLELQLP